MLYKSYVNYQTYLIYVNLKTDCIKAFIIKIKS